MLYRIAVLLFHLLLALCSGLTAQGKWTLNQCVTFAIKNNLQLSDAGMNEKIAEINFRQSRWNRLPGIGAGSDAGMNYGRSVDPNTNGIVNTSFFNNSYYLGASVDLFRGFMMQNQVRYREFRKNATEKTRLNMTDDLAFSVMDAFFNVIYFEEIQKVALEQKSLSELTVKKTEILVTTGLKSPAELLEIKANYEKDELFCIQAANNLASAWISLKKAMNLPPDQQIELSMPETEADLAEIGMDINELYLQHTGRSPYIQIYENEWKASLKNLSISKSGFTPSISLQASYNTGFYETNKDANNRVIAFRDQIDNNRRQFLGATLTIPVFSKNSVRFNVQSARIASEQAQTRLNLAKQTLLYEMEGNYNELTASRKELQQAQKQLDADNLAFQAAQKKFDQGMINAIELNTTKNRLASTNGMLLHAKLTFAVKKRMLDFYRGARFWEVG